MSDFGQFLPSGSGQGERTAQSSTPKPERGEAKDGRIIGVPSDLGEVKEATKLRGRVEHVNNDSTVRISTPRGDVEVRLERNQTPPKEGQPVEVEIQPGKPPTEITVRNVRAERTQEQPPQDPTRSTATPVNVEIHKPPPRDTARPSPEPIRPQEHVRLLPLAPDLIQQIVVEPIAIQLAIISTIVSLPPDIILSENAPVPTAPQTQEITAPTPQVVLQAAPPHISNLVQLPVTIPNAPQEPALRAFIETFPALNFETPTPLPAPAQLTPIETILNAPTPLNTLPIVQITPIQPILFVAEAAPINVPIPTSQIAQTTSPLTVQITDVQQPFVQITEVGQISVPNSAPATDLPPNPFFTQISLATETDSKPLILQTTTTPSVQSATIVGFIEENRAVVSFSQTPQVSAAPLGEPLFVVSDGETFLPLGTTITVAPQSSALPSPIQAAQTPLSPLNIPPAGAPFPVGFLAPSQSWPVMDQIYQAIAQTTPQAAQAMTNMTPNAAAPTQFGAAALFFIAAIRSGDLTSWLGDKTNNLLRTSGKSSLTNRLSQEGTLLSRAGAEPVSQDWRGVALPHVWQNEIHKIALYYKQDGSDKDENQGNGKPTRFLFDLDLDKMGNVQLDGLFHGLGTKNMRLDLAVRTGERFNQNMQADMRRIYAGALKQAQVTGELSFQTDPKQWVHINADKQAMLSENI